MILGREAVTTDPALAGKYRVERTIGSGAMGVVVAARHVQLGQRVAIKYLVDDAFDYPDLVERFSREARALAAIRSEHVAKVHDIGTLSTGLPYMVLEYLEGADLEWYLTQGGALPQADAVRYILEICEALAEAHAAKIIHRDLKPANIFIANLADGRRIAKLLDFGVSKLMDEPMTKTAILIGTALYMSPEHLRSSRAVDARTDIWALGVVLYELLTGEAPFVSHSVGDLAVEVNTGKYPPLASKLPGAPHGLSDVIAKCLERDREKRFGSALDLAVALEPFADKRDQTSVATIRHCLQSPAPPPVSVAPSPSRRSLDVVITSSDEGARDVSQRRPFVIVLALLLVLLGALAFASFSAWRLYSARHR